MTSEKWTLSLSVRLLSEDAITGLSPESKFEVGAIHVTVLERHGHLVLQARDFESEEAALAFVPRLKASLWNLTLQQGIAFVPFFEQRRITPTDDPEESGRKFSEQPGQTHSGPIHGLTEDEGIAVYKTGETIIFASMHGRMRTLTPWALAERVLCEGARIDNSAFDGEYPALYTALDLYLAHLSETSMRARFLTLVMALEVLSPVTEKHAEVIALLESFSAEAKARLSTELDENVRDAIETLVRDLAFRKETSIRRRVRQLILDTAPIPEPERANLARCVVKAYDLRSALVHQGAVKVQDLNAAFEVVHRALKLILKACLMDPHLLPK